ncbi:hypothetical protein ANCCAN_05750 [Ancylostoma caninum]|uniref:Uncharacterized protein n=1 Tax=Ancylostoma caninum TaxID=29170 RepID=A0A368GV55_ANCCA|nr:hypothetical protein ANCCAN_05750 [Ancylostoma caninum]
MAKLIEAFDMMTAQENAFLGVLRNIVEIHDQATKDVAAEIEHMENKDEKKDEKKEEGDSAKKPEEDKEEDENDEELIKETLRELEQVSLKALAAAELNEKLVETLQRHKKSNRSHVISISRLEIFCGTTCFLPKKFSSLHISRVNGEGMKSVLG